MIDKKEENKNDRSPVAVTPEAMGTQPIKAPILKYPKYNDKKAPSENAASNYSAAVNKAVAKKRETDEELIEESLALEKNPKVKKYNKSSGEKAFDRIVYTGIGFGLNEAISLYATVEMQQGWGRKLYDKIINGVIKTFKMKDAIVNGEKLLAKDRAANVMLMILLWAGGTSLIIPMKKLEDHRSYWVKKLNHLNDRWHGNRMSEEEVAARDEQVEKDIACEPKQTWKSMLPGRLLGGMLTPFAFGTFVVGTKGNERLRDGFEKLVTGNVQPKGQKTKGHAYLSLLPVETYSCMLGSAAMEIYSKFFARKGSYAVHNTELCSQVVHEKEAAAGAPVSDSDKPDTDTKEKIPEQKTALELATGGTNPKVYKKKNIMPTERHTDLAKTNDTNHSLAP